MDEACLRNYQILMRIKLWHLSAHALFQMYKEELETGKIIYPGGRT